MARDLGPLAIATPRHEGESRSVARYFPIAEHGLIGDLPKAPPGLSHA